MRYTLIFKASNDAVSDGILPEHKSDEKNLEDADDGRYHVDYAPHLVVQVRLVVFSIGKDRSQTVSKNQTNADRSVMNHCKFFCELS